MFGKYVIETGRDSHPSLNFRCVVWDISTGETLHMTEWCREPTYPRKEAVKWCCEQLLDTLEGSFVDKCGDSEYREYAIERLAKIISKYTLQAILANQ